MYRFQADIPQKEFTAFVEKASFAPIQQTAAWSKLKNNWRSVFCGIYRDDRLIGVALILIRKLMPGIRYAYCPRGPILDLTDREAVQAFTDGAFAYCKKQGVYLLKIDPAIPVNKVLPDMAESRYCDFFDTERGKIEFDTVVSCGFQPREDDRRPQQPGPQRPAQASAITCTSRILTTVPRAKRAP